MERLRAVRRAAVVGRVGLGGTWDLKLGSAKERGGGAGCKAVWAECPDLSRVADRD